MSLTTPRPWRGLLKGMLIGVAVLYLIQLPFLLLAWAKGIDPNEFLEPLEKFIRNVGGGAQFVLAAICGMIRAGYHPIGNPKYRDFLETSPWNHQKPLPLGAVHLLLADWIILLAWTAIIWLTLNPNALYVPMVFLTAYLLITLRPLFKTDQEAPALILAFGLAAVIRFWQYPIACTALLLGLYVVAYVGLMGSLKSFPWPKKEKPLATEFGWPLDRLGPRRKETQISFPNALIVALLVTGWVHAIISHVKDARSVPQEPIGIVAFIAVVGMIVGLIRLGIYKSGYASPISLKGRFWTGRWIIPKHDGVYLSVALLPVIGATVQAALFNLHWEAMYSIPISFGAILLASMTLPPNRRRWQLTGEHRLRYWQPPNIAIAADE